MPLVRHLGASSPLKDLSPLGAALLPHLQPAGSAAISGTAASSSASGAMPVVGRSSHQGDGLLHDMFRLLVDIVYGQLERTTTERSQTAMLRHKRQQPIITDLRFLLAIAQVCGRGLMSSL